MKTVGRWQACIAALTILVGAAGCFPRESSPDAVEPADRVPASVEHAVEGSHALTASQPATLPDMRRMFSNGFSVEVIVSEVQRRGVLRRPDADESRQIQALPEGQRLLDAMESPRNLLTPAAVAGFARRQGGSGVVPGQAPTVPSGTYNTSSGPSPADTARRQGLADLQRRRAELTQKIAAMKQRRRQMQLRGEGVHLIGIEIDRLERELEALPPTLS